MNLLVFTEYPGFSLISLYSGYRYLSTTSFGNCPTYNFSSPPFLGFIEFSSMHVQLDIQKQTQDEPYADMWRFSLCISPLFGALFCKFQQNTTSWTLISDSSIQWDCHALSGMFIPISQPKKYLHRKQNDHWSHLMCFPSPSFSYILSIFIPCY